MALSQSTNYNLSAANIINRSLNMIGAVSQGDTAPIIFNDLLNMIGAVAPWETPNSENTAMCLDFLNMMVKRWVTDGVHLWTQHEGVLVFDNSVATYYFPDVELANGSVGVSNADVFVDTQLSDDAVTSDTVLVVESNTGIAATDKAILVLDDGTRHVTTVASVASTTGVTLTDAIPSDASTGMHLYSYPVAVNQADLFNPRQIFNVRLRDNNGYDRFLLELSRSDYMLNTDKTITGTPMSFYIDDQLDNKRISMYPVPTDLNEHLRFTYTKSLDDVDTITDNVEFPREWLDALVFNLAVVISKPFGKENKIGTRADPDSIAGLAWEAKQAALGFGMEHVDIQFNPSWERS